MKASLTPNNRKHRTNLWLLCILIIIGAGVVILLEMTHVVNLFDRPPHAQTTRAKPTEEDLAKENTSNAQTKEKLIESTDEMGNPKNPKPETSAALTLSAKQSGADVIIKARMQSVADGTCALTASNGTSSVTRSADVIYAPDYSSCAGFSVAVAEIGPGKWSLKLTVTTLSGATASDTTTLEVK